MIQFNISHAAQLLKNIYDGADFEFTQSIT